MDKNNRNKELAKKQQGSFVISLDFELLWGMLDLENIGRFEKAVKGSRNAVKAMLDLFQRYGIHATWGIVGLMTYSDIESCIASQPEKKPHYTQSKMSAYLHLNQLSGCDPELLFAPAVIRQIASYPGQEIGSHSYSHYYCLEEGQDREAFQQDVQMAREVTLPYNGQLKTIILPRNQYNPQYADILLNNGFQNYRGTEDTWFYRACGRKRQKSVIRRGARILDNYLNIAGHHCYDYTEVKDENGLNNIRSSRYFRPYSPKLSFAEPLRIRRIKAQMRYAAKHHMIFHMWWHPYNMGVHTQENLKNLEEILRFFGKMKEQYHMRSVNMGELGDQLQFTTKEER